MMNENAPILPDGLAPGEENAAVAQRNMRREMRSRFLNMKCVNTIFASLVMTKLLAIVLVLSFFDVDCNKPLLIWTCLVGVKSLFELHFYYLLSSRVSGLTVSQEENFEEPAFMSKIRRVHEVIFLILFILGHVWYLADSPCRAKEPELYTLVYFLLALGYVQLAIPVFFILFVCLCMPVMLLFYVFFKTDLSPEAKDCLESLTVKSYDPKVHQSEDCVICYEEFKSGDKVITLPCNHLHTYHEHCIKSWLSIKMQCPLCKENIYELFEARGLSWD